MKDCRGCESLGVFNICHKKHKLEFEDRCKNCSVPFNYEIFWNNLMKDKDDNCPDYKDKIYNDPSRS